MKILIICALVILCSIQGCYTILRQPRPSEREIEVAKIFAREFIVNEDLLGVWRRTRDIADWGREIREIRFHPNGRFTYYSHYSSPHSPAERGQYRLFSDTVVIYFDTKYYVEKYTYRITDDRLQVKSLQTNRHETYFITELTSIYDTYRRFQ